MTTPHALGFDARRLSRIDSVCARYVDEGKLPFTILQIARDGQIVHTHSYGWADVDAQLPIQQDVVVRVYSMTKPVTSVALMMLVEEGTVLLDNAVSRFIPEFAGARVWVGPDTDPIPVERPVTVHDVMTHQAGVTAGFLPDDIAPLYRQAGLGDLMRAPDCDLAEACERVARIPLVAQPGDRWNYGMSTDVVGRIIEVASGMALDDYLDERIFAPLRMPDTGFWCRSDQVERLTACYARTPKERMRLIDGSGAGSRRLNRPRFLSGAGGLVSSLADYSRFLEMLRRGGALDGVRLIAPRTVDLMTRNHLSGGRSMGDDAAFLEATPEGTGFGLGFAVVLDPALTHTLCSPGEYYWGGAASTVFWVDPVEQITVIFLTQLLPSVTYPLRSQLRNLVYQALVEPKRPRPGPPRP